MAAEDEQPVLPPEEIQDRVAPLRRDLSEIEQALKFARGIEAENEETGETGHVARTELWKIVKPFDSAIELSDNVRAAVDKLFDQNAPGFRKALRERARNPEIASTPRLQAVANLSDKYLREAVVEGSFDGLPTTIKPEELSEAHEHKDDKREALLATAAHVVKRIESQTYQKIIEHATPEQLATLGLNEDLRALTVKLLKIANKTDTLYIRLAEFGRETGEPPEKAPEEQSEIDRVAIHVPGEAKPQTIATLFPKETGAIAQQLETLTSKPASWKDRVEEKPYTQEDAALFNDYLATLGRYYAETDPAKAAELHAQILERFQELAKTEFPLFVLPHTESYKVKPYFDPELSVYLTSADSKAQEALYAETRDAMADSLDEIAIGQFSDELRATTMRQFVTLGSYGFNLTFRQAAQELPIGLIFIDEQRRQMSTDFPPLLRTVKNYGEVSKPLEDMDTNFPKFVAMLKETDPNFDTLTNDDKRLKFEEYLCTMSTVFHEFGHPAAYLDGSKESKRLGLDALEVIDESKADILYRALIPQIIERGGIEGTPELWACAMLAASVQVIKDGGADDDYTRSNAYAINELFLPGPNDEEPAVVIETDGLRITNYDAYYRTMVITARRLLRETYEDRSMNKDKAEVWTEQWCKVTEKTQEAVDVAKGLLPEDE